MRLDDPRADTLTAYLRVLRDAQPKAFLLENVYGLAYRGKSEGLDRILAGIDQINRETGTQLSSRLAGDRCATTACRSIASASSWWRAATASHSSSPR